MNFRMQNMNIMHYKIKFKIPRQITVYQHLRKTECRVNYSTILFKPKNKDRPEPPRNTIIQIGPERTSNANPQMRYTHQRANQIKLRP